MTKRLLSLILFFIGITCIAQENNMKQHIEKTKNGLYLMSHGERFSLDKTRILIKPKSSIKSLKTKIIRESITKSGYTVAIIPKGYNIVEYVEELKECGEFETVEYLGGGRIYFTPNDQEIPSISSESNYYNKIKAYDAWNISTGSPNIKVAIIDTGFQRNHEDLGYGSGNNNYSNVSYSLGYDYINKTAYSYPIDNHGSMVAGIIGAKTNNGIGIAGITGGNHNQGVTMISYRLAYISGGNDYVMDSKVGNAIMQAVDDGADIKYFKYFSNPHLR